MSKQPKKMYRQPRMVYYVDSTWITAKGYRPSIVIEGEYGHHPTGDDDWETNPRAQIPYFWGPTFEDARAQARKCNERMGISEEDERKIIAASMRLARR